jgi:hypothetical protein
VGYAFAAPPSWSSGNPCAPSVLADSRPCADRPAGSTSTSCFYLYCVSLNNALATPANCIGVATADTPAGPFRDEGILTRSNGTVDPVRGPIGCGDSGGYSNIDPAPYVAPNGSAYLYLSTGHEPGGAWRRTLSVIPLASDRIHASSSRRALFSATRSWEAGVVEGPWVMRRNSIYYLFYSGGNFGGGRPRHRSRRRSQGAAPSLAGGPPRRIHSERRRSSTPRSVSRESAEDTDGRRAAARCASDSCVSGASRCTPSAWTVP